ncbi:MAG TPA: hypothetical protein VLU23_12735 [Pseudolabrys sp.]|jgi:hypothetical protein|nr:hypothetical protein [Pseudolabrys sp.]
MRGRSIILVLFLSALPATFARAQSGSDYNIMRDDYSIMVPEKGSRREQPEPWLAPKYKSPRGTVKHVTIPKPKTVPFPTATVPPPIVVPQTGRVLPNLPTVPGAGPGGRETFQDRAARCAHQAGVYGQAAGDRGTYMGTCVNQ